MNSWDEKYGAAGHYYGTEPNEFLREHHPVIPAGGRVLCVTALGVNVKEAADIAYRAAANIRFDGIQFRKDIGYRAIHRK